MIVRERRWISGLGDVARVLFGGGFFFQVVVLFDRTSILKSKNYIQNDIFRTLVIK